MQLRWGLTFCFSAFLWASSASANSAELLLRYVVQPGDMTTSIFRRLNQENLYGSGNLVTQFNQINFGRDFVPEGFMVPGRTVLLPLTEADIGEMDDQWVVNGGEVILNMKGAETSAKRMPSPSKDVQLRVVAAEAPLEVEEPVPEVAPQVLLKQERLFFRSPFSIRTSPLLNSKLITIQDSAGNTATLGSKINMGFRIEFRTRKNFLETYAAHEFVTSSFKPDTSISVEEASKSINQTTMGVGYVLNKNTVIELEGVYGPAPLAESSTDSLRIVYTNVPEVRTRVVWSSEFGGDFKSKIAIGGGYSLGATYEDFELGFGPIAEAFGEVATHFDTDALFFFRAQGIWRDYSPSTYDQTELGGNFLFGVDWQFGSEAE